MKGMRKLPKKPDPSARRFKGTDDKPHRDAIRKLRCLIAGRRTTVVKYVGVYPKVRQVIDVIHVCDWRIDPHHTKKKARGGHDRTCVPLCATAHRMADEMTNQEFMDLWKIDLEAEAEKLSRLGSAPPGDR